MSWSGVKAGDWVKVSQNTTDTEISGTVTDIGAGWVKIGNTNLLPSQWVVQQVRKAYEVGDIGLLKVNGHTCIGIYATDGYFYMHGTKMFSAKEEGIRILGNTADE